MTKTLSQEELAAKQTDLLNRVWSDDAFKARLIASPAEVLAELGFPVPEGRIEVIEGAAPAEPVPGTIYVVLPNAPAEGEVSDDDLAKASGGTLLIPHFPSELVS
jgi:hypothetical protein